MEGVKWFAELSDKTVSIKTHIYWSMKYCNCNEETLRKNILNIIQHYKGIHNECFPTSRCKTDVQYIPIKMQIVSEAAEKSLEDFLKSLEMYKKPGLFKYCDDSHWVETFNNALLQYHDKRIVFRKSQYDLRTNLAILDWNEHIGRPATSLKTVIDYKNPRRNLPKRVLKKKTNCFKSNIFSEWIKQIYRM